MLRQIRVLLAEHRDEAVQAFVVHDQEAWGPVVPVTGVRVLGRYVLELTFETGEVKMIDLEPDLKGEIFEALRADYSLFCQVRVDPEAATIVWPHGADYSPRTLYAESKPVVPA